MAVLDETGAVVTTVELDDAAPPEPGGEPPLTALRRARQRSGTATVVDVESGEHARRGRRRDSS